mgnify:CR=1 FL=1
MSLFEVLYWLYILFCTVLLPLWVCFKRRQKMCSLVLFLVPVCFALWLYSYLSSDKLDDDHGMAIAGLFVVLPLASFFCQFVLYTLCKVAIKRNEKKREFR